MNEKNDLTETPESLAPTDAYVFDEGNDDFVAGRSAYPRWASVPYVGQRVGMLFGLTGFVYSLFPALLLLTAKLHVGVIFVPLGFLVGTAFYWLTTRLADLRAEREGRRRWLVGEVLACRPWDGSFLSCTYAFLSPSGTRVQWTEVRSRRMRRCGTHCWIPERGTKVVILYIDDHHFRLL